MTIRRCSAVARCFAMLIALYFASSNAASAEPWQEIECGKSKITRAEGAGDHRRGAGRADQELADLIVSQGVHRPRGECQGEADVPRLGALGFMNVPLLRWGSVVRPSRRPLPRAPQDEVFS